MQIEFSERVKNKLKKLGKGVPWLADQTGISKYYLWDLLAGRRRWNEEKMGVVAETLMIEVRYIDVETDEMYRKIKGEEGNINWKLN